MYVSSAEVMNEFKKIHSKKNSKLCTGIRRSITAVSKEEILVKLTNLTNTAFRIRDKLRKSSEDGI